MASKFSWGLVKETSLSDLEIEGEIFTATGKMIQRGVVRVNSTAPNSALAIQPRERMAYVLAGDGNIVSLKTVDPDTELGVNICGVTLIKGKWDLGEFKDPSTICIIGNDLLRKHHMCILETGLDKNVYFLFADKDNLLGDIIIPAIWQVIKGRSFLDESTKMQYFLGVLRLLNESVYASTIDYFEFYRRLFKLTSSVLGGMRDMTEVISKEILHELLTNRNPK